MKTLIKDLYNSEINAEIAWTWDGGFEVSIGSKYYSYEATDTFRRLKYAKRWLIDKACELYPQSKFAYKYNNGWIPKMFYVIRLKK